ncbi:MAG TPA: DUF721 domain-containing protein [bacterium]
MASSNRSKVKGASSLGEAMQHLLRSLRIESKVKQHLAVASWPEIVGPGVAKVSAADRVENGILFVKVESSTWRNELMFMRMEFVKKVNAFLGENVIQDIRFK